MFRGTVQDYSVLVVLLQIWLSVGITFFLRIFEPKVVHHVINDIFLHASIVENLANLA